LGAAFEAAADEAIAGNRQDARPPMIVDELVTRFWASAIECVDGIAESPARMPACGEQVTDLR
jgi:hypothetical protein